MKFYVISDNVDTQMGMRLAGIEGTVVHEAEEVIAAIEAAASDSNTGVVLVTKKLVNVCSKYINDYKLNRRKPLIVEIPDRHGDSDIAGAMEQYISEAIGLKM